MKLTHTAAYSARGLDEAAIARLGFFGEHLLGSPVNVTALKESADIETKHFLDALSLMELPEFNATGRHVVDVGSGGGIPAVVVALARPGLHVTALESSRKKAEFVARVKESLGLTNLDVVCDRAETAARGLLRGSFDIAVTRAVGTVAVVAELTTPFLGVGGLFVAMKAALSDQELSRGTVALDILGVSAVSVVAVSSFAGIRDRCLVTGHKVRETPALYPRRPGAPARRPLG